MSSDKNHQYFDPKSPEIPTEVLGIPTEPLRNLTRALGTLAFIEPGKMPLGFVNAGYHAKYSTDHALAVFPLIERMQSGQEIKPEDIRPYRKPIKRLVPGLSGADRLAAVSSIFLVGIPARKAINRKIENELPHRIAPLIAQASEYLPQAEPYIDFLSGFENPRVEFVTEVGIVTESIRHEARNRAQQQHRKQDQVTAEDAAEGIRQTISSLLADRDAAKKHLPMFSYFVVEQIPEGTKIPKSDVLGVIVPEIISALETTLPPEQRDRNFRRSVEMYPHPKRGLAELFKPQMIRDINEAAVLLLPSMRDLLPTSGGEVKQTYHRVEEFLKASQQKTKP